MKRHVFLLVTLFTMSTVAAQQQPIISPKDSIPSVIERVTGKENKGVAVFIKRLPEMVRELPVDVSYDFQLKPV